MAQLSTNSGVSPMFTLDYERIVHEHVNTTCPVFAMFRRDGRDFDMSARTHVFGILTGVQPNFRTFNDDPTTFPTNNGQPTRKDVQVAYKKIYGPYRVSWEVFQEATKQGALTDVVEDDLRLMADGYKDHVEWQLTTGDGSNCLFQVGPGNPSNAASSVVPIQNYGGLSGEQIGVVLENLNLLGFELHAAADFATNARVAAAATVTAYDTTLGAETITVNRNWNTDGVVANDIVYLSRDPTSTTTAQMPTNAGLMGLVGVCDNYSVVATFQTLTAATAPNFKAYINSNGGVKRPLTEELLQKAISVVGARAGRRDGEVEYINHTFVGHRFQRDVFAGLAAADRRATAPTMWGKKGVKPVYGTEFESTTFYGIPWVVSDRAPRNRVFLVDTSKTFLLHNGPAEGMFMPDAGPKDRHRVSNSPQYEYVYTGFINLATKDRACHAQITDLTSMAE